MGKGSKRRPLGDYISERQFSENWDAAFSSAGVKNRGKGRKADTKGQKAKRSARST
jgi:hypothetical protein